MRGSWSCLSRHDLIHSWACSSKGWRCMKTPHRSNSSNSRTFVAEWSKAFKSNVFFDGLFWKLLYCRSSLSRVHFEIIRCLGVGHVQCFLIPTFSVWSDVGVQGDSSRNAILLCFIPTQSPPFQVSDLRRSTSFHWASCKIWIQTGSTASILLYLTSFHVILQYLILRNISFVQGRRHSHFTCQSRASISFALILWRTTWRAISCNTIGFATVTWPQLTLLLLPLLNHWLTFAVSALLKAKGWWP